MNPLTEYEQRERDKHAEAQQHRLDLQRTREEMSRFYANQIAELKAVETQRDILVTTLHMILAEDVGADRRGKGAKAQVRAVRALLGRLGFW